MEVQELINKFINQKKRERLSQNTILTYTHALNNLELEYLFDLDSALEVKDAFRNLEDKYSAATTKQFLTIFKAFLNFLQERKLIDVPYTYNELSLKIKLPNRDRNLSFKEQKQLLDASNDFDKFIIILFIETGIRIMEFQQTFSALDSYSTEDGLDIIGKGDKPRTIFISDKVFNAYSKITEAEIKKLVEISVKDLRKIISGYSPIINKKITPHWFRHTFGYNWVNNGGRLEVLQRLMGHSDIKTTYRYAAMDKRTIKQEYNNVINHGMDQANNELLRAKVAFLERENTELKQQYCIPAYHKEVK